MATWDTNRDSSNTNWADMEKINKTKLEALAANNAGATSETPVNNKMVLPAKPSSQNILAADGSSAWSTSTPQTNVASDTTIKNRETKSIYDADTNMTTAKDGSSYVGKDYAAGDSMNDAYKLYSKPDRFSSDSNKRLGLGFARGGLIPGKVKRGEGDNVLVPMQTGEYVLPEETTSKIGKDNLDKLVKETTGKHPLGSRKKGFSSGGADIKDENTKMGLLDNTQYFTEPLVIEKGNQSESQVIKAIVAGSRTAFGVDETGNNSKISPVSNPSPLSNAPSLPAHTPNDNTLFNKAVETSKLGSASAPTNPNIKTIPGGTLTVLGKEPLGATKGADFDETEATALRIGRQKDDAKYNQEVAAANKINAAEADRRNNRTLEQHFADLSYGNNPAQTLKPAERMALAAANFNAQEKAKADNKQLEKDAFHARLGLQGQQYQADKELEGHKIDALGREQTAKANHTNDLYKEQAKVEKDRQDEMRKRAETYLKDNGYNITHLDEEVKQQNDVRVKAAKFMSDRKIKPGSQDAESWKSIIDFASSGKPWSDGAIPGLTLENYNGALNTLRQSGVQLIDPSKYTRVNKDKENY